MSKGDIDGVQVLGRKIKPVALGFIIVMVTFLVAGITDSGALDGSEWGDIVGASAATSAVLLTLGWWAKNQRMAEYGLLLAFFTFGARTAYLVFTQPVAEKTWVGIGTCVIAVGAYLLERNDGNRRGREQKANAG
jgi:hypothetical protein